MAYAFNKHLDEIYKNADEIAYLGKDPECYKKMRDRLLEIINEEVKEKFLSMINRYVNDNVPPQYIINKTFFFNYPLLIKNLKSLARTSGLSSELELEPDPSELNSLFIPLSISSDKSLPSSL